MMKRKLVILLALLVISLTASTQNAKFVKAYKCITVIGEKEVVQDVKARIMIDDVANTIVIYETGSSLTFYVKLGELFFEDGYFSRAGIGFAKDTGREFKCQIDVNEDASVIVSFADDELGVAYVGFIDG